MQPNFISEILASVHLSPHGMFTGCVGAVCSLFLVNGNSLTWKKACLILLSGIGLCGYTMEIILGYMDNVAIASILNILIGFLAADLLSSFKQAAPQFSKTIVGKLVGYASSKVPGDESKETKLNEPPQGDGKTNTDNE